MGGGERERQSDRERERERERVRVRESSMTSMTKKYQCPLTLKNASCLSFCSNSYLSFLISTNTDRHVHS